MSPGKGSATSTMLRNATVTLTIQQPSRRWIGKALLHPWLQIQQMLITGLPIQVAQAASRHGVMLDADRVEVVAVPAELDDAFAMIKVVIGQAESDADQEAEILRDLMREIDEVVDALYGWFKLEGGPITVIKATVTLDPQSSTTSQE